LGFLGSKYYQNEERSEKNPLVYYPGPEVFLGLANAKCEKTREEKGKTSGEFVSDSWFG
jgi:hypothetical protein